jgi:hypothetical protein
MLTQLSPVYNITRLNYPNYPNNEPPIDSWVKHTVEWHINSCNRYNDGYSKEKVLETYEFVNAV